MAQSPFGGAHTERKLIKLETYLDRFTTALKNQRFRLIYFDAFAGTGDIPQPASGGPFFAADEYQPFIVGSAERALKVATKTSNIESTSCAQYRQPFGLSHLSR